MSLQAPQNEVKDYQVPCHLLPATEFDMSLATPPEQRGGVPSGALVRDEVLHEPIGLEFIQVDKEAMPEEKEKAAG